MPVISTKPWRASADWKLKVDCAEAPPSANRSRAPTWVGTSTGKSVPASGPDPMVRVGNAVEPVAATDAIEPNAETSVVR